MNVPDIVEAVTKVKESKIVRYRNENNRASGIGYAVPELEGCLRRGVYDRTHWKEKEIHDVKSQFIFDEGHSQEKQVLRDLDEAGIKVINQQQPFVIYDKREGKRNQVLLSGTIEGKIVVNEVGGHAKDLLTFEIKSMNPMIFQKMHVFEDFKKKPWTLAYMAQMISYMLGENENIGLFILKDKSNGTLRQIEVPLDYELGEAILRTCEQINDHIEAGTLPERRKNVDKCSDCPHKSYCLPNINWERGPAIADDPEFESRLDELYLKEVSGTISEISKQKDKLYKSISSKIKSTANGGSVNIQVGKYLITGNTATNGSFRPTIKLIDGDEDGEE